MILRLVLVAACVLGSACAAEKPDPTLAIINGAVWSGVGNADFHEAVFVSADTIVAVGSNDQINSLVQNSTVVIDANGGTVLPGFIDSHVHLLSGGFRLSSVQLRDAATRSEFISRIGEYAGSIPAGDWIVGGDWDHTLWGGDLPTRDWIDSVTTDHPVWITRLDGHMGLANSLALKLAGVEDPDDIPGGEIVRSQGKLTGLLKDNAMNLIWPAIPDPSPEQNDRALIAATDYLHSHGVTSVHDMGGSANEHATYDRARKSGQLRLRIYAAHSLGERFAASSVKHQDEWLQYGAVKGFVDGSLGSHTAAFFDPYTDKPDDSGFFVIELEELRKRVLEADSLGLQLMIHAIGDRAIHTLLNIFEELGPSVRERRHRIEHNQHLHPPDLDRFAELGIIASMQPYHAADDGRWAEDVIGKTRSQYTYAFRKLLDAEAVVAFGSDWFVAPPIPMEAVWAAVARETIDGKNPNGWIPEERISLDEALTAHTATAAFAGFSEDRTGKLVRGMLADIVVMEADLFATPSAKLRGVQPSHTIVGGQIAFQAE